MTKSDIIKILTEKVKELEKRHEETYRYSNHLQGKIDGYKEVICIISEMDEK